MEVVQLYNPKDQTVLPFKVERLGDITFKLLQNDDLLGDWRLVYGTEIEAKEIGNGAYELIRITKESDYITRRFWLSTKLKESELRAVGGIVEENGGFWEVVMSAIAIITYPKTFDLDALLDLIGYHPAEFHDDRDKN